MKKILMIIEATAGGTARHVIDLSRGLTARGHDVRILWSPTRSDNQFRTMMSKHFASHNTPIKMTRAPSLSDLKALKAVIGYSKEFEPDIIHAHSTKAGLIARCLPSSTPKLYTPHAVRTIDPGLSSLPRLGINLIESVLSKRTSRIIAVSSKEQETLIQAGISSGKIEIITNGIPLQSIADHGATAEKYSATKSKIKVVFSGRFDIQKDPEKFAQVIMHAHRRDPRIIGVMYGDGPLKEGIVNRHSGYISFPEWTNPIDAMRESDALLMTSRYEAMPYSLLEALAAGLPIVTTNVGGASETIEDGKNGYIVPVSSAPEAIAEHILGIFREDSVARKMSQRSLEIARTHLLEEMVEKTDCLYSKAIACAKL